MNKVDIEGWNDFESNVSLFWNFCIGMEENGEKGCDSENNKTFIEKYRDVIKKVTTDMTCFLIGIENQSDVNYAMPLRVMLWDALSYQEQIRNLERRHKVNGELTSGAEFLSGIKKEDRLKPVCTIVVYYDEKEWDGSRPI